MKLAAAPSLSFHQHAFRLTVIAMATGLVFLAGCSHQAPAEKPPVTVVAPVAEATQPLNVLLDGPSAPPMPAPVVSPSAAVVENYAAQAQQKVFVTGSSIAASVAAPSRRARHAPMPNMHMIPFPAADRDTSKFPDKDANGMKLVADEPLSTFSVDVDTASYAYVRRMLTNGELPPSAAVRVEEMVNYFPYQYATPTSRTQPFGVTTALMPNPWKADTQLIHIGVRGFDIQAAARPRANVVLLIDVSGSMQGADRLELLKKSFHLFAAKLRPEDRVSIVTYANGTATLLEPTPGTEKDKILSIIDGLQTGGRTAGADGLQRAYALAERHFDRAAVNRVILATDGDFNLGIRDPKELEKFIINKRKSGVYLSILGVGHGNLNDSMMQRLAQAGNGNAAYIDTLMEARKALSEELGSTMFPIANDVKVQVEFNPAQVAAYRLVGYETRMLEKQDFNDDKIDAGDMGAGHTVTAIYEITPASAASKLVDPLRYQKSAKPKANYGEDEVCLVKVRYKLPGQSGSRLTQQVVKASSAHKSMASVPDDQRFAVAVAAFGQRLRSEKDVGDFSYSAIADLANGARGADAEGYRAEFVQLVRMADTMNVASGSGRP